MANNRKNYTRQELENLSKRRIDKGRSLPPSKQPIKSKPTHLPTRLKPIQTQDCRKERQMLQEVSQLSSPEAMLSRLEGYLRNNEPCLNMTSSTRNDIVCSDFNGDGQCITEECYGPGPENPGYCQMEVTLTATPPNWSRPTS
jgi:hypothetical protein